MPNIEHKESHQKNDHVDWLRPQEQSLLGGEIGVYDARFIVLLNELQEEGQITSWERSPDLSSLDHAGVDYLVRIKNARIPFQITGEVRDAQRRKAKRPHIPVIHFYNRKRIKSGESPQAFMLPEHTKRQIMEKAEWYLNR